MSNVWQWKISTGLTRTNPEPIQILKCGPNPIDADLPRSTSDERSWSSARSQVRLVACWAVKDSKVHFDQLAKEARLADLN